MCQPTTKSRSLQSKWKLHPHLSTSQTTRAFTPQETTELVSRPGVRRTRTRSYNLFLSAVSAGCLLAFGGAASLVLTTDPWRAENAPGVSRMLGAAVFPVGVILIALTGADLFTAGNMCKRISVWELLSHWAICFLGNLDRSLFVEPEFHNILPRGVGCNWLVCLALYLSVQANDLASKVIGIWFPIFAFVILGLDHVVANMFFIPLAIWLRAPGLDVGLNIWKRIIPTTIGNVIGGAVFVGGYYW
ncbi:Formate/nitrite transporter [Schizothecium vesticola]|uniref:Formate/nitrite transporter n=1 Tax=Schizothecium vesticola TaxID=314040 RepID=A0AA40F419_9PEZI|nr:Formate/nitrite transporter [Schizothecium vesticola]